MAQAAANLQAALLGHGKKEKDVVTPHTLIARIERAAPIAGWNTDDRKCTELLQEGRSHGHGHGEILPPPTLHCRTER